jgi:hypothetical protein
MCLYILIIPGENHFYFVLIQVYLLQILRSDHRYGIMPYEGILTCEGLGTVGYLGAEIGKARWLLECCNSLLPFGG